MKFSELILAKAGEIFQKHTFQVVEQQHDYLQLQSEYLTIIIAHDFRDNSNTLFLGRNDAEAHNIEIDDEILSQFFQSDLPLSNAPANDFADNLILFFKKEAILLSGGDRSKIYELEKFDLERAQRYTTDLLIKQQLPAIDIAWKNKNFKEFVNLINQVDKRKLSPSYSLKLKIAADKVK